jgi:hypothetical protein
MSKCDCVACVSRSGNAMARARKYAALQDKRAKLVREWEQLELEIASIDEDLNRMERK